MKKTLICTLFVVFLLSGLMVSAQNKTIFIAPDGNDAHLGTIDKPIKTIQKAQAMIAEKGERLSGNDTLFVVLREGTYRLLKGLVFTKEHTGTKNNPVIFKSYKDEKAIVSGGRTLSKFKALSKKHPLYKKNKELSDKIIEIDLKRNGIMPFGKLRLAGFSGNEAPKNYFLHELFFNKKPVALSRWPNKGFSEFSTTVSDTVNGQVFTGIVYKDPHVASFKNEPNVLLHGYWKYLWADAYEQALKIDIEKNTLWLNPPYNHYKFAQNKPFAVYNAISEIDVPGEWAYDYTQHKIYFYPPGDFDKRSMELSVCKTPLLTLQEVENIHFKDLIFEMGAQEGIRMIDCSNSTIDGCTIRNFARDGVIIKGGDYNAIVNCEITALGRGAIVVDAGNRTTLEKGNVTISNCHIHHLSRIDRTYTPGIWVDGVGTTITNCKMHDIPSSAIRLNGNDHLVAYNDMYHVVTESDDQGAIDMWGDPTYRGNVIKYNYIHDIGPYEDDAVNAHCGRAGIRFDDTISGNLVFGNIFNNCSGGNFGAIQIHGGKENLIQNNLFYNTSAGVSFTPWNQSFWLKYTKKTRVFFAEHKALYVKKYPRMNALNDHMNVNTIQQNVFVNCNDNFLRKSNVVKTSQNIMLGTADFSENLLETNFDLKSMDEKLKGIGFKTIPFDKIGLKHKH